RKRRSVQACRRPSLGGHFTIIAQLTPVGIERILAFNAKIARRTMRMRRALISGNGIAGASIAYWLVRAGWEVTIVERAAALRSSGPVDVRGDAVAALRAMGCYEELRALSTAATDVEFVARPGRPAGRRFRHRAVQPHRRLRDREAGSRPGSRSRGGWRADLVG